MIELLFVLGIYSLLILIFVPLEKIGKVQTKVREKWNKLKDK